MTGSWYSGQDVVQPGLVLHDVVDAGQVLQRPLHVGDQPGQLAGRLLGRVQGLLDGVDHPVLVEVVVLDVRLLPAADFQLALGLGVGHVDALLLQPPQVVGPVLRVDDVEGPVALLEAVLDERHQHPVLLLLGVEEGADVAGAAEDGPRQPHRLHRLGHDPLLRVGCRQPVDCTGRPLPCQSGSRPPAARPVRAGSGRAGSPGDRDGGLAALTPLHRGVRRTCRGRPSDPRSPSPRRCPRDPAFPSLHWSRQTRGLRALGHDGSDTGDARSSSPTTGGERTAGGVSARPRVDAHPGGDGRLVLGLRPPGGPTRTSPRGREGFRRQPPASNTPG